MAFKVKQPKTREVEEPYSVKIANQRKLFLMDRDKEYNGWTNYTTWGVALNIDSEQWLQEDIYEQIKSGNIKNGYELKDYFKQTLEDSGNYSEEYNSYKIADSWTERELESDVNWFEIFESYKENIKENEEYEKKKQESD